MSESTYTLKIVETNQTGDPIDITSTLSLFELNSRGEWRYEKMGKEPNGEDRGYLYWGDFVCKRLYR